MWKFLKWFFWLFSSYVNPFEKKVDKFFRNIKSTDSIVTVREELLSLMQEDLVVLNVWLEKKFKGYTELSKGKRKGLYRNRDKIISAFKLYCENLQIDLTEVKRKFEIGGLQFPVGDEEKFEYLLKIAEFLKPGRKFFYVKSSSFWRLLKDPETQQMEGDCNQIVTFYIYLYSLKYPVDDLKIKLLPEHVCLHFREIDLEATTGEFTDYNQSHETLPVTEIISTNVLDVHDLSLEVGGISDDVFLKSAQLAYAISSLKEVVSKNLKVAYHNMTVGALKAKNFDRALFYAEKLGDQKLIHTAKLYKASEEYNELARKVSSAKTVEGARKHRADYQKMLELTRFLKNPQLEKQVKAVLDKL